jgi:hypothetical protein
MTVVTTVSVDRTRADIRREFARWDIDPSEFEIVWAEDRDKAGRITRLPGVRVRYMRNGKWQEIACFGFPNRAANLRQCYLLLERLRIAEQHGVQYEGLTFTKEVATVGEEAGRKQDLLDAYDILGASPDDPVELIRDVYKRKSMYYHPDRGGDPEKMKRLTQAYDLVMKSRGAK